MAKDKIINEEEKVRDFASTDAQSNSESVTELKNENDNVQNLSEEIHEEKSDQEKLRAELFELVKGKATRKDVEKFLRKNTFGINLTDENGWTALMVAAQSTEENSVAICKYLINKGADVKHKANNGQDALSVAKGDHVKEILEDKIKEINLKEKKAADKKEKKLNRERKKQARIEGKITGGPQSSKEKAETSTEPVISSPSNVKKNPENLLPTFNLLDSTSEDNAGKTSEKRDGVEVSDGIKNANENTGTVLGEPLKLEDSKNLDVNKSEGENKEIDNTETATEKPGTILGKPLKLDDQNFSSINASEIESKKDDKDNAGMPSGKLNSVATFVEETPLTSNLTPSLDTSKNMEQKDNLTSNIGNVGNIDSNQQVIHSENDEKEQVKKETPFSAPTGSNNKFSENISDKDSQASSVQKNNFVPETEINNQSDKNKINLEPQKKLVYDWTKITGVTTLALGGAVPVWQIAQNFMKNIVAKAAANAISALTVTAYFAVIGKAITLASFNYGSREMNDIKDLLKADILKRKFETTDRLIPEINITDKELYTEFKNNYAAFKKAVPNERS